MKFRKKPVVIEAMQFTEENKNQVFNFVTGNKTPDFDASGAPVLRIQTLEGVMTASLMDWIIKGVSGEFYPCKPDIFAATYEAVSLDAAEKENAMSKKPRKLVITVTESQERATLDISAEFRPALKIDEPSALASAFVLMTQAIQTSTCGSQQNENDAGDGGNPHA